MDDNVTYRREIAKIREIQAYLLPDFRNVKGFDIDSTYLPAQDISGDFLDGYYLSDDIYQLIICDVSGHGMASAYVGNEIRTIFRVHSSARRPMEETVRLVNSILVKELADLNYYCTAIICRLNLSNGTVHYLNAGHPAAVLCRAGEGSATLLDGSGALIGLFEINGYSSIEVSLAPGDYLVLYTDGITEAMDFEKFSERGMFGAERVVESVTESIGSSSKNMLLSLISRVYEFTEFAEQLDDMTAICMKRR